MRQLLITAVRACLFMTKKYWVGEFFVDLTRNQLSLHGHSQTLPPKALQVLTVLAKSHGQVVSYDMLLDTVWPNSVVTPNTLQRSIAQLRKALGENSKAANIIKTHAKQGYSLESDVCWSEEKGATVLTDSLKDTSPKNEPLKELQLKQASLNGKQSAESSLLSDSDLSLKTAASSPPINASSIWDHRRFYLLMAVAIIICILGVSAQQLMQHPSSFTFGELRYLTATDDKEYGATYSHDGEYIIFHRYLDKVCVNNVWAKNATTLEETQLTTTQGTYRDHSLSPDGKHLLFIEQNDCTQPITQNTCHTLMQLDFNAALQQPQTPTALLHCQNTEIDEPIWVDNSHIVMLQKDATKQRLVRYSLADEKLVTLYEIDGGNVLYFTYSAKRQEFAATVIKADGLQYIEKLTVEGEVKSSHHIQLPDDAPRQLMAWPAFAPNNELMLTGFGGQLYTLSETGKLQPAAESLGISVGAPYFHPSGERLLLITGRYDSDVATMQLPADSERLEANKLPQLTASNAVLKRSIETEDYAKFQPNGEAIAFVSEQTGTEQVWLFENGRSRMLSRFPKRYFIRNILWGAEGKKLLVQANRELHIVSIDGSLTTLDFPFAISDLFHWDSEKQQATANILVKGIETFVEIDLAQLNYSVITQQPIEWAAKDAKGELVFLDHLHRFWLRGNVENTRITALAGQGSDKRFVIDNQLIYGINRDNQLWRYQPENKQFTLLAEVPQGVDYLTDIRQQQFLLTLLIAEKKEVIEIRMTE